MQQIICFKNTPQNPAVYPPLIETLKLNKLKVNIIHPGKVLTNIIVKLGKAIGLAM